MSFSSEMAEFRKKRMGSTADGMGGGKPPAGRSELDSDPAMDFSAQMSELRKNRGSKTIQERADFKTNYQDPEKKPTLQRFGNGVHSGVQSGFYRKPTILNRSGKVLERLQQMDASLAEVAKPVEAARSAADQAEKDLLTVKGFLDQARAAYDAEPNAANMESYNQIVSAYNLQYQVYSDAYDAYSEAYKAYEPYEKEYVDVFSMYQTFADEERQMYNDWRGTIRDSGVVKQEIDEIDARISALKGERNADRLSGLPGVIAAAAQASALGTQSGQMLMPSELHAEEIAALEKKKALLQEEQDWAMFYKYHDLMDRGDFEEKSKYVSTANGKERGWLERVQGLYVQENSPWDDPLYEYINGNAGAGLEISNQAAAKWKGLPLAEANARTTKGQERVEQMTEDEVKIFNYLYATQGKDAAYEYYDYLKTSLNARQQEADAAAIGEASEAHPVMASVLSVGMAPMKGLSYLGQIADLADDGKIDENDAYNRYSYLPGAIRGQISDKIEQSGKWGKVGSFAYQTAMSMGDFLINAGITGGYSPLTLSIMGTGAAADGTIEAKKRGLDDGQAFLLGTIAGAAEIITEKVSLEALLDVDMLKDSVKKYILKNMLAEGSEEVGSDFINLIADIAVAKNKSEWQKSVDAYRAKGKTEGEAWGLAFAEQAAQMGADFLGGMLSGGLVSGVNAGIHVDFTNSLGKELTDVKSDPESVQAFIETGLESDPESAAHQLAAEMQEKVQKGETPSEYELAELWQANEQAIQAEQQEAELAREEDDQKPVEGLSLPSLEQEELGTDHQHAAVAGVQETQNGTKEGLTDAPLSIAEKHRQEQQNAGGTYYDDDQRTAGPAAAKPRTEIYPQQGTDLSNGGQQRDAGAGTGEQAGRMAAGAEQQQQRTDRSRETIARQNYARHLRLEKVSSRELGLSTGTDAKNIQIMPEEHWDGQMQNLAERIYNETGKKVSYVLGRIQVRGVGGKIGYARGVISGENIIVQADNLRVPMEQIADHEAYHAKADFSRGRLNGEIRQHIIDTFSLEQFQNVLDKYIEGLRGVVDVNEARTGEAFENAIRQIEEELFADAYAGINAFGAHADQFTEAVNQKMDQLYMGRQTAQENGTEEPTGPPSERFSYAGEHATNADMDALRRAKEMQQAGVADETIRQQTGWFVGMDGKWRWEIDDSGMRYDSTGDVRGAESAKWAMEDYESAREDLWSHADIDTLEKVRAYNRAEIADDNTAKRELYDELINGQYAYYFNQYVEAMDNAKGIRNAPQGGTLQDYIDHPNLFNAYPQLRNVTMRFERMGDGDRGYYDRQRNEIVLNSGLRSAAEKTLVHEIQHAIQKVEGFARGATQEYWEQVQKSGNAIGMYDQRIEKTEKQMEQILLNLPENIAEQFREWRRIDSAGDTKDEARSLERAGELNDGPYSEEFNEFFMLSWQLDQDLKYNYNRGGYDLYRNTAGEIEARDVADRRELTAEQRKAKVPATYDERTVFANDSGISLEAELSEYPYSMQTVIADYMNAVDTNIVTFVKDVLNGNAWKGKKISVGIVDARMASDVEKLTGISGTEGNTVFLSMDGVKHINRRHGPEGKHDHSMANINDIARIGYVLNNYDQMYFFNDSTNAVYGKLEIQ